MPWLDPEHCFFVFFLKTNAVTNIPVSFLWEDVFNAFFLKICFLWMILQQLMVQSLKKISVCWVPVTHACNPSSRQRSGGSWFEASPVK
jgi:hypothetical protein